MKIVFVMDKRVNAGSIQAIASYVRAGDESGHTFAMYGRPDSRFPTIRFTLDVEDADYVAFIIESGLNWMSGLRLPRILESVPWSRRVVVDADGMYNPLVRVDGYDRNHPTEERRQSWLDHCDLLGSRVYQPTFAPRLDRVGALPFYGYDPAARLAHSSVADKRVDILHVGHNWWRWREVSDHLLPAFRQIRGRVGPICFTGSWWNGTPPSPLDQELEQAFCVDTELFRQLSIDVEPAVPYTQVIPAMSKARVNIMTQRPLFRALKLLTSKYFEIFAADTIPLVMLDADHAEQVYGPAGRHLALYPNVAGGLQDALKRPDTYRDIVNAVRKHLEVHHSYHNRVQELVDALDDVGAVRQGARASCG